MEPYMPILTQKEDIYNVYKWRIGSHNEYNDDGWEICEHIPYTSNYYWRKLRTKEERDELISILEKYYDMTNCKCYENNQNNITKDDEENKSAYSEVDELNTAYLNISQHQELSDISEIRNEGESNVLDISSDFEEEQQNNDEK